MLVREFEFVGEGERECRWRRWGQFGNYEI